MSPTVIAFLRRAGTFFPYELDGSLLTIRFSERIFFVDDGRGKSGRIGRWMMDRLSPELSRHVNGGGWSMTCLGSGLGLTIALCCWRLLELI